MDRRVPNCPNYHHTAGFDTGPRVRYWPEEKKDSTSIVFATCAYPAWWHDLVVKCMQPDNDQSAAIKDILQKARDRFIIRNVKDQDGHSFTYNWECIMWVVSLVRMADTNIAYDTHGAISTIDGHLINLATTWTINPRYQAELDRISKDTNTAYWMVLELDMILRRKRACFHIPELSIRYEGTDSIFIVAKNNSKKRKRITFDCVWTDITLSEDPSQYVLDMPKPIPVYPACYVCNSYDNILTRWADDTSILKCAKNMIVAGFDKDVICEMAATSCDVYLCGKCESTVRQTLCLVKTIASTS